MLRSRGIRRSITPHQFSKAVNFQLYYWKQRGIVILAYQFFNKYRLTDSNKITEWSRRAVSVPDPLCTAAGSSLRRRQRAQWAASLLASSVGKRWEKWCLTTTVHNGLGDPLGSWRGRRNFSASYSLVLHMPGAGIWPPDLLGTAAKQGDWPSLSWTAPPVGTVCECWGTSRDPIAFSWSLYKRHCVYVTTNSGKCHLVNRNNLPNAYS